MLTKPSQWLVGALAVTALSVWSATRFTPLEASSHREAPLIADDPLADNTDVYAFVDPSDASRVVLIADYIPFQLPQGGPNYTTFGEKIHYEIHVKNKTANPTTDDFTYRFTFTRAKAKPENHLHLREKRGRRRVYHHRGQRGSARLQHRGTLHQLQPGPGSGLVHRLPRWHRDGGQRRQQRRRKGVLRVVRRPVFCGPGGHI
ncbi:MAG: DUF4331 domain-containing protein [Hymenobacter sp.]|nr:MAG: DUF4331 domain-containing protein [Hymenobacter sp.]